MSKVMFVTVGTSLFHSASWELPGGLEAEVPGYTRWLRHDFLTRPERRLSDGSEIRARLLEHLRGDRENAARWARRLPENLLHGDPPLGTFMRYSAEMATILKLAEQEREGRSLGDFLRSYQGIHLVCDPDVPPGDERNLSNVAGAHLAAYLNAITEEKDRARICSVPGLSTHDPEVLLDDEDSGLRLLSRKIAKGLQEHEQVDLVISGGYKLYGIFLAPLLYVSSRRARIVYIHEEGHSLLKIENHGRIGAGKGEDFSRLLVENVANFSA